MHTHFVKICKVDKLSTSNTYIDIITLPGDLLALIDKTEPCWHLHTTWAETHSTCLVRGKIHLIHLCCASHFCCMCCVAICCCMGTAAGQVHGKPEHAGQWHCMLPPTPRT
jgi:hypothetical protein